MASPMQIVKVTAWFVLASRNMMVPVPVDASAGRHGAAGRDRPACPARGRAPKMLKLLLLLLILHAFAAKRQGASCRQAAVEGCHNPTPCWTRQIQARHNQPWARCSVFISPPASRGQLVKYVQVTCKPSRSTWAVHTVHLWTQLWPD